MCEYRRFILFILVCREVYPNGSTQFTANKRQTDIDGIGMENPEKDFKRFIKDEFDSDKDGLLSKEEMVSRIEKSSEQQTKNEIEALMSEHDLNQDNKISWNEFSSSSYPPSMLSNSEDLKYDKQKFKMADADDNGFLNSKEFASFYFPEADNENLIEWMMVDWLNKVDLNHDGYVTISEFLASQTEGSPDIRSERKLRKHFYEDYDINKDGRIDKNELREWLLPHRASAIREAGRILKSADENGDGNLSMNEIENNDSVLPLLHNAGFKYHDKDEL